MGSLMAGWDSPVHDPKSVNLRRNRSLTKEEIATFWRSKKNKEEENELLKASYKFSKGNQENTYGASEKIYKRSNSVPLTGNTEENLFVKSDQEDQEESEEKLLKKNGWWIRSNWAFLNEPPVISTDIPHKYTSQFDVARKHLDNSNSHGIST